MSSTMTWWCPIAMVCVLAAMSCADAGAPVSVIIISRPIFLMVGIIVTRKRLFHSAWFRAQCLQPIRLSVAMVHRFSVRGTSGRCADMTLRRATPTQ